MYSCSNEGCRQSFKWRQQLARHRLKCDKPVIAKEKKFVKLEDCYKCSPCGVAYRYKTGLFLFNFSFNKLLPFYLYSSLLFT